MQYSSIASLRVLGFATIPVETSLQDVRFKQEMTFANNSGATRPTIAIVGFSVRAATQCARRQGFEVVAVDFCSDRDLLAECTEHFRLDDPNWPITLNGKYPGAPVLLTGGMEHRTHLIHQFNGGGSRFGTSAPRLPKCVPWTTGQAGRLEAKLDGR